MSNSNSIRNGLVILIAFILAIWMGVSVVTEQSGTLVVIAGSTLLLSCIFLGRKIWLFMIFFVSLDIRIIRGFGTVELAQSLFVAFTFVITLMRRQNFRIRFGEKEMLVLAVIICVVQVYLRNPVGLNIFGSGSVGARPYFVIAMSALAGILLGNIEVKSSEIKWALWLTIIGSFLGLLGNSLRMRAGGRVVSQQDMALEGGTAGGGAGRNNFFASLSPNLAKFVIAFASPLRSLIHPFWGGLILLSAAAAALSGYRNTVALVGLIYLAAIAYRGGGFQLIVALVSGALALGCLALVNIASPLPPAIQRALSPFPGTWDQRYVDVAEESTEWRVEMWKEAILTDYWIQNKIFGDGLGMTRRELQMAQDLSSRTRMDARAQGSALTRGQVEFMINGAYHSGPVQTVRAVGYVGLAVLLIAMIRMAVHAHRQIIRCKNTEWFPVAMYFGIPILIAPIFFVFIVGDFGSGAASLFFAYGMLGILEKNLPIPAYAKRTYVPFALDTRNRSKTPGTNG